VKKLPLYKKLPVFGVVAFLFLGFAITITVAAPLMDKELYQPSPQAKPLDALASKGREIYAREGCWYCHTQTVRTIANDKKWGPRASQPGDYAYSNPALLGSERTGPDLTYVGDRWPDENWQIKHLQDPRALNPDSVMPSFAHLPQADLQALAHYLVSLKDNTAPDLQKRADQSTEADIPDVYKKAVNPFAGDTAAIAAGDAIFHKSCWSCHGATAEGNGPAASALKPPPANLRKSALTRSEQFLFWIVSEGSKSTAMPAWKKAGLTEEQRWQVVSYIKSLGGQQ